MSNVDTLLDLGDASAPPQDTNQTNPPNLLDPFDQLAPSTESLSPQRTPEQTDLLGSFDPFSSTTMSSATNGDAAIDASLSTDQVKTMEQEFDDLLGGFSSTTEMETVTNGTTDEPVVNLDEDLGESSTTDDIVTVTQKTTNVDGETVITETRTETLSDGRTLIETSSVTEKETEATIDTNGLENGEQAESEKKMSTSSDKELRLSSTSESTSEVKGLEESLPDYQPPKRNVKKEERKPSRGPSTFIAGGSENQCKACGKRVYEMEKMIADKAIYHKMCFKCAKCNRICSLGNFAAMDGQIFCKPHFISMFKTKGNYDEGFGREKHTKQWANRNSSPATFQAQSAAQDAHEEPAANADSRINYEDEDTPNGDDYSRDSDILRETPEKEPIHFEQLSSVRSHFESLSKTPQEQTFTPKSSKTSKWDKPKSQTPAPVVNRYNEDGEEEEEADGQGYKPVRRITPPRDHVEGYSPVTGDESDEEVQRDPNIVRGSEGEVRAEELPPPAVTKNLLAKFRSMEDINQDAPSPARTPGVKKSHSMRSPPRHEVVEIRKETYETRSSEPEVVNGHDSSDTGDSPTGITKESEANVEAELPERGYTRNLVAQWRSREELFGGTPEPVTKTKSAKQTPSSVSRKTAPVLYSQPQHDEPVYQNVETANHDSLPNGEGTGDHSGREIIRSDDAPNIEDELPPRSMARNMRSMFENMAVESEREREATTPKSSRKKDDSTARTVRKIP